MADPVFTLYVPRRIHELAQALEAESAQRGGTPSAIAMAEAHADSGHEGASRAAWGTVWQYLMDQAENDETTCYEIADVPAHTGLKGVWSDKMN